VGGIFLLDEILTLKVAAGGLLAILGVAIITIQKTGMPKLPDPSR